MERLILRKHSKLYPIHNPLEHQVGSQVKQEKEIVFIWSTISYTNYLNRLENVLAAAEWCDPSIAEGLLLDVTGNVIECTRSNLFMVCDGALLTPDLSLCGVAGVQRERVIEWAAEHGVPCCVKQFGLAELLVADEVFLVNSVIGLWPVRELPGRTWGPHPISAAVLQWLSHASD